MKDKNDKSKGSSFWAMVFSIGLHAGLILLILYWGFGPKKDVKAPRTMEVAISGIEPKGSETATAKDTRQSKPKPPPKKPEVKKTEPKTAKKEPEKPKEVEEVKPKPPPPPPPPPPEKKEEPEKVEKKEPEPPKKEPEKKEVLPLEPEKKEEPKKVEKKEEKKPEKKKEEKKVEKKPTPTKPPEKTAKSEDKSSDMKDVIRDIEKRKFLKDLEEDLGKGEEVELEETPIEDDGVIGERDLAMADSQDDEPGEPAGVSSGSKQGSGAASPVIIRLYTEKIHQKISRNWTIPPSVPTEENLESLIFFKIDESGKVYDVKVNESSGNKAFDDFCVRAIYKSAPLPPPPQELVTEAKNNGIVVPFRNEPY